MRGLLSVIQLDLLVTSGGNGRTNGFDAPQEVGGEISPSLHDNTLLNR